MKFLYKDVMPVKAIKKKDPDANPVHAPSISPREEDEREKLRKQCQRQHFTFTETEIANDPPPVPPHPLSFPLPTTQRLSVPPPPPVSHTIVKDASLEIPAVPTVPMVPADGTQTERDLLKAGLQNRDFSMLLGEEDSPTLFDQVDSVDPNRETGETSQRRGWRGVSDVSDMSEAPNGVSGMFEKRERGGYLETIEDEHAHNVVELRRYQQEEDAWNDEDREELVQGDVYVIDDADRFLKEESSEREADTFRSSTLLPMPEESGRSTPEGAEVKKPRPQPRKKRDYVGRSKESILIMQDIDGLADMEEDEAEDEAEPTPQHTPGHTMRLSPHSTLLPSVVSMSSSHYNSLNSNSSNSESSRLSPITDRRQDFFAHPFTQKHNVWSVCNKRAKLKRLRKR